MTLFFSGLFYIMTFSLATENCEHFAKFVLNGKSISHQVNVQFDLNFFSKETINFFSRFLQIQTVAAYFMIGAVLAVKFYNLFL